MIRKQINFIPRLSIIIFDEIKMSRSATMSSKKEKEKPAKIIRAVKNQESAKSRKPAKNQKSAKSRKPAKNQKSAKDIIPLKMSKSGTISSQEKREKPEEKVKCPKCGSDSFRVYMKVIVDDARLYCSECGEFYP